MRVHGVKGAMAAATVAAAVCGWIEPAVAGGSRLSPVRDRYEAGEVATLVGYTGGPMLDAHREPGPYRAFLQDETASVRIEVGTLDLDDRGQRGWESLRVAVRFRIPPALPPGPYTVEYCVAPCERPAQLGDVIGGYLFVGIDPPYRPTREWPADEPEIANLADDALLSGPGAQTTAGEMRASAPAPAPAAPVGVRWESFALIASTVTLVGVGLAARRRARIRVAP